MATSGNSVDYFGPSPSILAHPCNTDQNRAELDPPKLPKVQPSLTNPIVPCVSEDDFSPFKYSTRWVLDNDDGLPIVAIHKTTLKGLEDHLRHLYEVYKSFELDIEQASVHGKSYHESEREIDLKRQRVRLFEFRGFDNLRTYANSRFKSVITIRVLREINSTLTDKLGVTLSVVENMDLEQAVANLVTRPAVTAGKPTAEPAAPAVNSEQPSVVATPSPVSSVVAAEGKEAKHNSQFIPLTGWHEILAALNEPHDKVVWKLTQPTKDKIRKLNETHCGPINFPSVKGAQPYVGKLALMAWWAGLETDFARVTEELEAKAKSEQLTVAESHNYGTAGTVIPGISGSVKPSRATGKKGKEGKR